MPNLSFARPSLATSWTIGMYLGMGLFLIMGLGMLVGAGWYTLYQRAFLSSALTTQGTVVDYEEDTSTTDGQTKTIYFPLVEYTDTKGKLTRFRGASGSTPPSYDIGESVDVRYPASQPQKAKIGSFSELWLFPLILLGMGLLFSSIGGVAIVGEIRKALQRSFVQKHGQTIQADLIDIQHDQLITRNGQSAYRINAQWQDPASQRVYTFISDPIWFNPTSFVKQKQVSIKIHPNDPKQYLMDTSFLPPEG